MATLTPIGIITKWILLPVGLAALGYFVVGPNIGRDALKGVKVPANLQAILPTQPGATATNDPTPETVVKPGTDGAAKGPSFDVSVLPVSAPAPKPRRRRTPRPVTPKPVENAAPATTPASTPPEADPASGGETTPPPDQASPDGTPSNG
ncbi:hypothetical protein BH11ARM1_BH11ARM1_15580 [soil metagenome]